MAGRRSPCAKCGTEIVVPAATATVPIEDDDASSSGEYFRSPQYVGVDCRVCQTRLYGTPDQVGQELKCPDCGARTVLRPPRPAPAKKPPAALEGDQYELWDADAQPLPSKLIADQPKYVPVECGLCGTLMQATLEQVGQAIACPDCGKSTVVPPPPVRKPAPSVLTSKDAYAMDESAAPSERPPVIRIQTNRMQFEVDEAAARAEALADPKGTRKRRGRLDARGRPILPRWPLVTGILPFMLAPGVSERWVAFSTGYLVSTYLIMEAIAWGGAGGLATFSALMFFVAGMITGVILTGAAGSVLKDIVTESSDGNEQVQVWNTRYIVEWFPELLYIVFAVFASAFPGSMIARLTIPDVQWQMVIGGAGAIVLFPLVYLSQLYANSPWAVLSGRILATLGRCPGSWLLFYLESALLWGGCLAAGIVAPIAGVHPVLIVPLYVAAFLLYARLLGRLGWRLAEAMPARE